MGREGGGNELFRNIHHNFDLFNTLVSFLQGLKIQTWFRYVVLTLSIVLRPETKIFIPDKMQPKGEIHNKRDNFMMSRTKVTQ